MKVIFNNDVFETRKTYSLNIGESIDCSLAYTLLSRIPGGVIKLLETFEQYVANLGKKRIINMGNSISKV